MKALALTLLTIALDIPHGQARRRKTPLALNAVM